MPGRAQPLLFWFWRGLLRTDVDGASGQLGFHFHQVQHLAGEDLLLVSDGHDLALLDDLGGIGIVHRDHPHDAGVGFVTRLLDLDLITHDGKVLFRHGRADELFGGDDLGELGPDLVADAREVPEHRTKDEDEQQREQHQHGGLVVAFVHVELEPLGHHHEEDEQDGEQDVHDGLEVVAERFHGSPH